MVEFQASRQLREVVFSVKPGLDAMTQMTERHPFRLSEHKYKLLILLLLVLASAISVMLALARMAYSDSRDYASLIWNLFLAWIPFVFALPGISGFLGSALAVAGRSRLCGDLAAVFPQCPLHPD